jgi:exopolysaccharide production protein ExoZ
MFNNLQALRAYAALSVAMFHFSLVPATAMPWQYGSFGVDLFFVLSGFIIAYSSDRDPRHFLIHRAIRVLPPYWIATSIGALLVMLAMPLDAAMGWYGQSLIFLTSPEGRPPIIFVGWTLVYELAFYLVYAIILHANRRWAPVIAIPVLTFLAYAPQAAGVPMRTWPLLIEFAYGLTIFLIVRRARAPVRIALPLAAAGIAFLYAFQHQTIGQDGPAADQFRILVFGLPSAMIVLGLIWLEQAGYAIRARFILALGAASYALYLLHPLTFAFVLALPSGSFQMRATIFGVLLAMTVLVALAFHYWIEAPLMQLLRRLAGDKPSIARETVG